MQGTALQYPDGRTTGTTADGTVAGMKAKGDEGGRDRGIKKNGQVVVYYNLPDVR